MFSNALRKSVQTAEELSDSFFGRFQLNLPIGE